MCVKALGRRVGVFRSLGQRCNNYLEVHCTYNLLRNCSYNPSISRVAILMGLIFRL